jgi:hypothetical protein
MEKESLQPAPFIVGVGRSGTTLLRLMLDHHPIMAIPPETHFSFFGNKKIVNRPIQWVGFFREHLKNYLLLKMCNRRRFFIHRLIHSRLWNDFHIDAEDFARKINNERHFNLTQGLRTFYKLYAERFGKSRWGDKTPKYVHTMKQIQNVLPEARFIHLIRDGRDVAISASKLWFGLSSVKDAATYWVKTIAKARHQARGLSHYLEIRYEDLVLNTENTLKQVCQFIELPWHPDILKYHQNSKERLLEMTDYVKDGRELIKGDERRKIHELTSFQPLPSRIGRWKEEMEDFDRKIFESVASPMLRELGYEI